MYRIFRAAIVIISFDNAFVLRKNNDFFILFLYSLSFKVDMERVLSWQLEKYG